jgi:large subunit ribosomal protein L31
LKVVMGTYIIIWPQYVRTRNEVKRMKQGIHPNYVDCTITCACGNVIKTRSTKPEIHVEVCSKCHPFYTGKQKLVDTGGRVERFNKRFGRNK